MTNFKKGHKYTKVHGHSYEMIIKISGDPDKKNNWINSFKYSKECLKFDLKNIWRDHYLTNPIARSKYNNG